MSTSGFPHDFQAPPPPALQDEDEVTSPLNNASQYTSSTVQRHRSRRIQDDTIREFFQVMQERKNIMRALRRDCFMASTSSRGSGCHKQKAIASIRDCIEELYKVEGLPRPVLIKALNLFKEEENRVIFMTMYPKDRLEWILIKTGSSD